MPSDLTVIVLAAGGGTRMKSGKAKVLHEIGGRSLLACERGDALDLVRQHGDELDLDAEACQTPGEPASVRVLHVAGNELVPDRDERRAGHLGEYTNVLSGLQERRDHECRLIPERALGTLDEAEAFLRDRGLLTRNPSGSLPSLFGACHEEPYKPGAGGFGEWPRTKWPWSFELALRPGVVAPKIHLGKTLYLSEEPAALVDPIVRDEIDRMTEADEDWARVLAHLAEAGPSTPDDLVVELGLPRKELKAIRAPLERCGVVVTRWEGEQSFLARWDQLVTRPARGAPDLGPLVVAAVRAAVVVPEREPARWFSWRWRWEQGLLDRLVEEGALVRPEPGWLAAA